MATLQKANLGVAPSGAGGDDQRTANMRFNANFDVLSALVALGYKFISDNSTLVAGDVGARIGINMGVGGKAVKFPLSSSVPVNSCVHLFNVGPPVAIGFQGDDGSQINLLNTGDWAMWIADGGKYWHVAARGRMLPDEVVSGFLAVSKGLTVGDRLTVGRGLNVSGGATVSGALSTDSDFATGGTIALKQGVSTGQTRIYNDPGKSNFVVQVGAPGKESWLVFDETGLFALAKRPTWAGAVPWDSANLAGPMDLGSAQTVSGLKSFSQRVSITKSPVNGNWDNAPISVLSPTGLAAVSLASNGANSVVQLRASAAGSALEIVSGNSSTFQSVTCYSLTQTSDALLKTDVKTIENSIEKLKRLRGVSYVMKSDETRARHLGVIAQEVAKEFPEAVTETSMQIDESGMTVAEGGRPALAVNYSALIGPLLQAFIELEARVSALER